ncbi:MAG: EamA family transporter, partial [Candidatus Obscuribacterales bacterium]|nr:EamA family transporter [Candidatus Obscuribacterales bacterium]
IGCAMGLIGAAARTTHPLLIVFLWELTIGLVALVAALTRGRLRGDGFEPISIADFRKVILYSSPTVIGTFGYAYAASIGSIAVISAVLSAGSVIAALIAFLLYRERLSAAQYTMIALCCAAIAGLNICESIHI